MLTLHPTMGLVRAVRMPVQGEGGEPFDALYQDHFGFVWRCLRGLGVAQSSLDDAAQEVFVVVHRRLAEFRGDSSVRTWLYAIVRNIAANQRRSAQRGQALIDATCPRL